MTPRTHGRVLLAEDDDDLRDGLTALLSSSGYEVTAVRDGAELLDYLGSSLILDRQRPPPDAIISDIRMPGFNGLSILEGLRWAGWMTPFILISAFGDGGARTRAERVGATAFLDKPLDLDRLEPLLKTVVEQERDRSRGARRALLALCEDTPLQEAIRCLRHEDFDELVVVHRTADGIVAWGVLTTEILLDALLESNLERMTEVQVGDVARHWFDDACPDGSIRTTLAALAAGELDGVRCIVRTSTGTPPEIADIVGVDSPDTK